MAKSNLTKSVNIDTTAREVDFVSRFAKNWEHLRDIMGIMRTIRKTPGTVLKSKYASVTLQSGSVAEGNEIPYSQATVATKDYAPINVEKYAKAVSIEAINEHGYEDAVGLTDDQFLFELQNNVTGRFYDFLNTGSLLSAKAAFQAQLAEAQGQVRNKWKAMHKGITEIVGFCNILDVYTYLGAANVYNVENQFGLNYIKNFMGYSTLFLLSDNEIPSGTVIATPVENIDLYYVAPNDSDFQRADLDYRTDGETNYIGIAIKPKYDTGESVTYAMYGMTLFSEYLDGIAVINFGAAPDSADLTSLTIGNLTLTPTFDPAVTSYTAATTATSNKVNAKTKFTDTTVSVKLGSTEIGNGGTATWSAGENTLTVKVTNDSVEKTYTVTVTKS
jgi:hypothetical protein